MPSPGHAFPWHAFPGDAEAIIALAALVFGWAVLARPLERTGVSAPMLFVAAGLLLGNGHIHDVTVNIDATTIRVLAEITLALVLFSDASSIDPEQLRHDAAWPTPSAQTRSSIGSPGSEPSGTRGRGLRRWKGGLVAACAAGEGASGGTRSAGGRTWPTLPVARLCRGQSGSDTHQEVPRW